MTGTAIALLLAGGSLLAQASAEPYAWPLDLPRELTSSFGEYRPGRYHMGIDLRTGPIGKNVYAADDGSAVLLACSPNGYGKAVYLRLADGNIAVYAHLNEFAPPLDAYVRREQHARKSYAVRIELKPGELPVKRGQLIAKSGQTGIGVPHLHYEIRDANNVTVNPGTLGVTWPDTTEPVFRKAAIIPLDPESRVNGDVLPVVRDARRREDGSYAIDEVGTTGPFAVAVDVFDPAAGGSKLGVYRLTTELNGLPKFQITHERLSYDHDDDGVAAYEPALADQGQFLLQWRKPGNESEIYPQGADDGRLEALTSISHVTVSAEDFAGNRSRLTIPVRPETPEDVRPPQRNVVDPLDSGPGEVTYDYTGVLFVATARFENGETVTPVLRVAGATPERVPMHRIGPRQFRVAYRPGEAFVDAQVSVEHPRVAAPAERVVFWRRSESTGRRQIDVGGVRLTLQYAQPYGMLAIRVRTLDEIPLQDELTPVSRSFEIWPPYAAVEGVVSLRLPLDAAVATPGRLLMYRHGRERWEAMRWLDNRAGLESGSNRFGVFAVMEDTVAPKIHVLDPAAGQTPASRRPKIRAEITDKGSGIDTYAATFGGQWLLMEYDPEQDLLVWEQDEDLPAGAGTLAIEVTDLAGNVAREEVALEIPSL